MSKESTMTMPSPKVMFIIGMIVLAATLYVGHVVL